MLQHVFRGLIIAMLAFTMRSGAVLADPFEDGENALFGGDYATALSIWRPLAEHGNANAQFRLGLSYAVGLGVSKNLNEAVKWYQLSATQGNSNAQINLALMYASGEGVTQDFKEALKLFRLSAAQGDAGSQSALGWFYAEGKGTDQDYARAHMWYDIASSNGFNNSKTLRDIIFAKMTKKQIANAQAMARKCKASNYKQCD
jgi:TPR repeat protein